MSDLKSIVHELEKNYKANPIPELEEELYSLSGMCPQDPHSFVLVPTNSPHMDIIGSACGISGNIMFGNVQVKQFFKEKGVPYFIGIVHHADLKSPNDVIPLCSVAVPLRGKEAQKLEKLADKYGGSLRKEDSGIKGWSVYETE